MAPRIVGLMLSGWVLLSAWAQPRPAIGVLAVATMGASSILASLLAFLFDPARLANVVNGALLVGLALFFPSLGPGSIQSDIIVPGLLLVLSTIPTRRLLPMVRAPHPDGARNSASG